MPDGAGNFRGIRVPRVPWHDELLREMGDPPDVILRREGPENDYPLDEFNDVELEHDPYGIGNPD